jgi:isocitrate/isopropylmalate dehydrogenase
MKQFDIAVIAGDGIGPEVTAEELKVLDAAAEVHGFKLDYHPFPFGSEHYFKTGEIFPDAAFEEVKSMDAILLGHRRPARRSELIGVRHHREDALRARPLRQPAPDQGFSTSACAR